jgi:hypothetical protein
MKAVNILRCSINRRIAIDVVLTPGPATILGDLGEMEGVFISLGFNAAQAMPQGGRLSFRSQRTCSGQIVLWLLIPEAASRPNTYRASSSHSSLPTWSALAASVLARCQPPALAGPHPSNPG